MLDELVGLDGTGLTWARGWHRAVPLHPGVGRPRARHRHRGGGPRPAHRGGSRRDRRVGPAHRHAGGRLPRARRRRLRRAAVPRRRTACRGHRVADGSCLGVLERQHGPRRERRVSEALPMAERALALLSEGSDSRNVARLRSMLANLQLAGDPPRAGRRRGEPGARGRRAPRLQRAARSTWLATRCRARVCSLLRGDATRRRRPGDARPTDEGRAWRRCSPPTPCRCRARRCTCSATRQRVDRYRAAVLVLTGIGADRSAARLWFDLGTLLEASGETAAALDAFRRAAASTGLRGTTVARATTPAGRCPRAAARRPESPSGPGVSGPAPRGPRGALTGDGR